MKIVKRWKRRKDTCKVVENYVEKVKNLWRGEKKRGGGIGDRNRGVEMVESMV